MATQKRRRFLALCLAGSTASLLSVGCSAIPSSIGTDPASARMTTIAVSAAASLQDVLEAIAPQFQAAHADIAVDYNFASSGHSSDRSNKAPPPTCFSRPLPSKWTIWPSKD